MFDNTLSRERAGAQFVILTSALRALLMEYQMRLEWNSAFGGIYNSEWKLTNNVSVCAEKINCARAELRCDSALNRGGDNDFIIKAPYKWQPADWKWEIKRLRKSLHKTHRSARLLVRLLWFEWESWMFVSRTSQVGQVSLVQCVWRCGITF